jgi:hypothetical protein
LLTVKLTKSVEVVPSIGTSAFPDLTTKSKKRKTNLRKMYVCVCDPDSLLFYSSGRIQRVCSTSSPKNANF